jgi:methylamine--corrinoid protein Co-methyltransferase
MLSLLEIAERSQKGRIVGEKEWDLGLFAKMKELTQKYAIAYPNDGSFFNVDDRLVDRAFEAALDFLEEIGVYCITTNRVIEFTRREVLDAVREAPNQIIVGTGRDQRVITQKKVEGHQRLNHCAGLHAPWSEELAPLVVKNFAQISSGDYLEGFNFSFVDGREIFGMPMEAYAARRQVAWLREGIRKAGRPGMAIAYYPINTRAAVLTAPIDPESGLRPTDGILLTMLPGVKMEHDVLTAAIVYEDYGCFKVNGGGWGLIGGFAGGAEGAIIEGLVQAVAGWLIYRDSLVAGGVSHLGLTTAGRMIMQQPKLNWASSVVRQVLATNTGIICFGGTPSVSGPGHKSHLLELAFSAIQSAINGCNLYFPRQGKARMNASQTPLEAEWMMEVADATIKAGLTRGTAQPVLEAIVARLEGWEPEEGLQIQECYDLVHHKPSLEYERIYKETKEELISLGLLLG